MHGWIEAYVSGGTTLGKHVVGSIKTVTGDHSEDSLRFVSDSDRKFYKLRGWNLAPDKILPSEQILQSYAYQVGHE